MTLRGSALKKLSRRFPTRGFGARCDWRWPRDCPRRAKRSSEPSARLRLVVALNDLDQVAGALALGLEVVRVVRIGVGAGGNPPMDRDALVYQTGDLERVVRHQIHGQNAQHPQHLRGDVVPAQVVWKAELAVGLVGIHPLGLQRIGLDLVAQADATALLTQVQDHPALALDIISIARSSCCRQSHFRLPKTSPVRHSEWIRTGTASPPSTWPTTRATCSAPSRRSRKTIAWNTPRAVGKSASEYRTRKRPGFFAATTFGVPSLDIFSSTLERTLSHRPSWVNGHWMPRWARRYQLLFSPTQRMQCDRA